MAAKRSDDYIPSYADLERQGDARKEYARTHGDPRSVYEVKYRLYGKENSEKVFALTQAEAVEICKQGWSMNGIYITVISASKIEKSEAEKLAAGEITETAFAKREREETENGRS